MTSSEDGIEAASDLLWRKLLTQATVAAGGLAQGGSRRRGDPDTMAGGHAAPQ